MNLVMTDNTDEFARLKLTLGRGLKQVKDRREVIELLNQDHARTYTLVIIGSGVELSIAISISEDLRVSFPTIGVILLRNKVDSSITSQAMSAGIRDVVHINDPEAIVVACKKSEDISRRQLQSVSQKSEPSAQGKVVVFHAPKDGLGVTTAITNIGTDLAHRKGASVCVLDSSPYMGDLAVRYRIEAQKSWNELLGMQGIDDQALSSVVTQSNYGPDLLFAPRDLAMQSREDLTSFNQVISVLQKSYQYVLIDTDSGSSEWNTNLLNRANLIVLLSTLDLSTLKNVKVRLREISALDIPASSITLYLNGSDKKVGIRPEDIVELIGIEPSIKLPWDVDVTRFANEGTPIVIAKERSGISHAFVHATDQLVEKLDSFAQDSAKPRTRSRKSA